MTQPGAQGYPDFGRFSAEANVLLQYDSGVVVLNGANRGPYFVGGLGHLGLALNDHGVGTRFTCMFFADAALTQLLTSFLVDLPAGTFFRQSIPVLGPWLIVTIQTNGVSSTIDFALWHAAGPFIPTTAGSASTVLISADNVNVGAGLAATDVSARAHLGWAQWSATMDAAAAWNHKLQTLDYTGVAKTLEYTSTDTGRRSGLIFLPGGVPQIVSTNADGVARARHVFLHALPGVP